MDWIDLTMMKSITVEKKTTKAACSTWDEMKVLMPELETKGLAVRLTVDLADVRLAGMYKNVAPYGTAKLKAECDKLGWDVNDPALPTGGIKSSVTGGNALPSELLSCGAA